MPAVTLTLGTVAGGAQRIIDLIRAKAGYANTKLLCSTVAIRSDDGNAGGSFVYLGGSDVSSANYGIRLSPGDSRSYAPSSQGSEPADLDRWVIGSVDSLKINVDWEAS